MKLVTERAATFCLYNQAAGISSPISVKVIYAKDSVIHANVKVICARGG